MFDIVSVVLSNFKSYRETHSFGFPTELGLYFLTGENRVEPKLGSNGAGKSTLLDAISWCLFGRSLRGLKATDIVSWGKETCLVSVRLNVAGELATITRQQNPNSLSIVKKVGEAGQIDQESLEKFIGLNQQSFMYSVIMPQFGQSFFELKPAEKLALFSQILGLDFWLDKSAQAGVATALLQGKVDKLEVAIQSTMDNITTTGDDLNDLIKKVNSFEDERDTAIAAIEAKIRRTEHEQAESSRQLSVLSDNLHRADDKVAAKRAEIKEVNRILRGYAERRLALTGEEHTIAANIALKRVALERLDDLGAECPTCLQIVDQQHLKKERKKLAVVVEDQKRKQQTNEKAVAELDRFTHKANLDNERLNEVLGNILGDINEVGKEVARLTERVNAFSNQLAEWERQKKAKAHESNPYTAIVDARKAKLRNLKSILNDLSSDCEEAEAEMEATKYWVAGFKRLRLFIIEETLRTYEVEVNNALAGLGLVDWQITFEVERENKSGGVTKGFVVFITCPSNPEPVRWESWSGGETQRLQLAGDFGLANLIMLQAGMANTIEFYDEPSDHLSDEGLVDLAETLQQRALSTGKRIMLVDHRMPDYGEFAKIYTVVKDEDGSHVPALG